MSKAHAQGPTLLVGCGKMGSALLGGWLARGLPPGQVAVVEPQSVLAAAARDRGVGVYAEAVEVPVKFLPKTIVLAVKPQVMAAAAAPYRRYAGAACYLSIAAGKTLANFAEYLGAEARVVRAMPNTPAAIGRGITVACPNPHVTAAERAACDTLLAAVGEVAWIEDETLMDAVTALSGSGPAYVFLFIECLAEAGRNAGLPAAMAMQLARATVSGAGELAAQSPDPAAQLRVNVTSPGGTTAAALDILMGKQGLQQLLIRAVEAATKRSRELAG